MSSPAESPRTHDEASLPYWCHYCNQQVSTESNPLQPSEIICKDCKNGFVELIAASPVPRRSRSRENRTDSSFSDQFLQILRLIAQAAHVDRQSQPQPENQQEPEIGGGSGELPWFNVLESDAAPVDRTETDDFLRIELDGWDAIEDPDDEDEEDDDYEEQESSPPTVSAASNEFGDGENAGSGGNSRRRRRDVLRLRIREGISRAGRDLDWLEILQGLEDNTIELRVELPESGDAFAGNPEDYVDAAGYEVLLQNFAENDSAGKGAPPASKSAVLGLPTVIISEESPENLTICAICKDGVNAGEIGRRLPCNHVYHEDCIVPWLSSRNSCPVCRFELPTDDPDYEETRKKMSGGRDRGRGRGRAAAGTSE